MNSQYVAIIQAGGKGTRMRALTNDLIPKPLLPLNGKPMMEWQMDSLINYGIKDFIIITGHLGNKIKEYFGNGDNKGVCISYIEESEPLGSAGALFYAKGKLDGKDIILIFGDVMFELDWNRFIAFHENHAGIVSLLAHPNAHPFDSDLLIADDDGLVKGIDAKTNVRNYNYKNFVNAGLSIFKNELLDTICVEKKVDFEAELVKPLIAEKKVYAYSTPEYVKDVGTPERFYMACEEQKTGLWDAKSLKNMQKAIFLDRDGTINVLKGFLRRAEDFELLPGVADAIKLINSSEYLAIVVTNQPVIARGECTFEELEQIHKKLETELGKTGAFINDLFFCPHHPHKGYDGEVPELKINCECRKPKIGMLLQAAEKYNIDLCQSWYIGDTTMDIQTGKNAGMKTILVETGEAGVDAKYDAKAHYVAEDMLSAVRYILSLNHTL
ncbi:MAG: HAD-IIIA family hydrolase [Lachnospiraceae bacterium]|nr:HAD-IIIA family hydrolase [Lachnospiraceae bacterium]